jgi:hypothetical protein
VSYEDAVRKATTDQGLDPVIAALTAADIDHAVEQTGGFTMVVTVKAPDGTFAITNDGGYLLGYYPGDLWEHSYEGRDGATYSYNIQLEEIVERIRQAWDAAN